MRWRDSGTRTKNTIKIGSNRVDVIKKGESSVHMVFEPDTKNMTCYQTPLAVLWWDQHFGDFPQ